MSDIKFAIIGCGRIAKRHAEQMTKYGLLKAVCDINIQKAAELANLYPSTIYATVEEMLAVEKDVDVVAVCSPNGLHAEHSIKALKAGFHVLCEKPMANTVPDAHEMLETAERSGKLLFIVKQNRFNPPVAAVKKAINNGVLGQIYSIQLSCFWNRDHNYYANSWKGSKTMDGGTLYTQFSHFIDLLYWMFGDVKTVNSFSNNYAHTNIIDFEDTGVVILKFESGVIGTINYTVNSYEKNMEGSLTVFAEKGTVKIGGQYLNELEYQCVEGFRFENLPIGNRANDYGTYYGSMSNHDKVYENVVDVLKNGKEISTNAHEGLKTVEIIDKIYNSMK